MIRTKPWPLLLPAPEAEMAPMAVGPVMNIV